MIKGQEPIRVREALGGSLQLHGEGLLQQGLQIWPTMLSMRDAETRR